MIRLDSLIGNSQRLDGGAMFGNVPRAVWSKWLSPDEHHRVPLACRCLLARNVNGLTVLFETGIGAFFEPKMRERFGVMEERHILLDSLSELGLSHEDIDAVVLSHLHFDHSGGLLAPWRAGEPPALLFPNAKFVVSARAWSRATKPHARDRASFIPELQSLLEQSRRLLITDAATIPLFGDQIRFHFSEGHTPGLMLSEIFTDTGSVVFCADLIPGAAWVHLPVTMGYDRSPETLIDEKSALLSEWHSRNARLFFTHDPTLATAHIKRDQDRFSATPDKIELRSAA